MAELNELTINGSNYTFEDDVARGLAIAEKNRAQEAEQSLQTAINNKVDKVTGKGLSTNDYTNEEKAKLAGLDNYDDTQVRQLINEEKAARQQGDNALCESISQEETRAKGVEQTLQLAIDVINGKMPAQATVQNQLADKEFVNSSISTATADFKGTYNSLQELEQVTANANDYAFVIATDAAGNTVYKRYKWVEGAGWSFEYDLNNSSFTAAQWAAIQSGITAALVTKLTDLPTNAELNHRISTAITTALGQYYTKSEIDEALGGKQNTIDDLASIRSGAQAGSTAVQPSTLNNVVKNTVAESGVYDVSANNDNTKFESLSALLSSANLSTLIPTDIRKGGMSIKFVLSSDNKYVQYFLTKDEWSTDENDWESCNVEDNIYYSVVDASLERVYSVTQNGKFGTDRHSSHLCISVSEGEQYVITPPPFNNDYSNYAFATSDYLASGADIPLVSETTVMTTDYKAKVTIPQGCHYLLVYNSGNNRPFDVKKQADFNSFVTKEELNSVENELQEVKNTVESYIEKDTLLTPTGLYVDIKETITESDGVFTVATYNNNIYSVKYIPIKKGDLVFLDMKPSGYNADLSVCVFAERPVVGSTTSYGETIAISSETEKKFNYTAPIDGWLAVAYTDKNTTSNKNNGINSIGLQKHATWADDIHRYVEEKIQLSLTSNKVIDAATWNEDGQGNSTFGTIIDASAITTYGISGLIDVNGAKYINVPQYSSRASSMTNFTIDNPNKLGSVFYDSNENAIEAVCNINVCNGAYPSYGLSGRMYIEVPSNAAYFRLFGYIDSGDTSWISVLKTKLSDKNIELDARIEVLEAAGDIGGGYGNRIAQAKFVGTGNVQSLGLLHFSDFHEDAVAGGLLLKYANKYASDINDVLCTGDVVRRYLNEYSPQAYFNVNGLAEKALFLLGNHDQVYAAGSRYKYFWANAGENGDGQIDTEAPKSEVVAATHIFSYNHYFKDFIDGWGVTMPTGYDDPSSPYYQACYWHKDYTAQKIRLIGIDCIYRFDGILEKDGNGDFVKDGNGMLSIATNGQGMAWLTTEQETWLYDLLMDTLDSSSDAYGYSVVIATHYPLDDVDGQCTIVDKANTGDGTIVNHRTGDNVLFCQSMESSVSTLDSHYNMRNRVPAANNDGYTKGTVNNVGDIIQHFIDSDGKFVAYICGHTHYDWFYYPKGYSDILCVVVDQTGNLRDHNYNARPDDSEMRLCANYYSIDTTNHLFKIVRLGLTQGNDMREKKYLCYDYMNRKVISEG